MGVGNAGPLGVFEIPAQVQQVADLVRGKIQKGQEILSAQVHRHCKHILSREKWNLQLLYYICASRTSGILMQRGPPRPRESSLLGMDRTRMPLSSSSRLVTWLRS